MARSAGRDDLASPRIWRREGATAAASEQPARSANPARLTCELLARVGKHTAAEVARRSAHAAVLGGNLACTNLGLPVIDARLDAAPLSLESAEERAAPVAEAEGSGLVPAEADESESG